MPSLEREATTLRKMIDLFCETEHDQRTSLCPACEELWNYARERLRRCPFQEGKTTCAKCPVHCYRPDMRERVRHVMRTAGPRMMTRHPLMALRHLWDGRREKPIRPTRSERRSSET
jgi:hypothetical protein